MSRLCECGCGLPTKVDRRFLHGHWSRTAAAKAGYAARRIQVEPPNPSGLCLCGCGQPTPIATRNRPSRQEIKGEHLRYITGHQMHAQRGPKASRWDGGRWKHKGGYIYLYVPDHPAANRDGYVYEHRIVAERMLGRFLEPSEKVHHINHVRDDNREENLVVFQSQSAHLKSHGAAHLIAYNKAHPEVAKAAGKKSTDLRYHSKKD